MNQLEQQLNEIISTHDTQNAKLQEIKEEIIKTKNAFLAYNYAMEFEDETKQLQKIVIKSGNANLIYLFLVLFLKSIDFYMRNTYYMA